jgi:pyrroline-5-carboxylate reductase
MMTEALVGGLINTETSCKQQISSSNPNAPRRTYMREKFGIETFADNVDVVRRSKLIVLSVKPH